MTKPNPYSLDAQGKPLPENRCAKCEHPIATVGDGIAGGIKERPAPGYITLCCNCGHVAAFNDDMTLRPATGDEVLSNTPALLGKLWSARVNIMALAKVRAAQAKAQRN